MNPEAANCQPVYVPPRYSVQFKRQGATIEQLLHPGFTIENAEPVAGNIGAQAETARESWRQRVQLVEAEEGRDFSGLRSPQVGAIYATLAHWKTTEEPATIVMPTGTGKTETMLALLVQQRCSRLLVVVPTDALRT
nr:hypothetical protein [Tanacetum cinerariifolium]